MSCARPSTRLLASPKLLTNESLELGSGRKSEYAKLINDSGRRLLLVVNGILDVSKMETGNFEITPQPFAPAPEIESCTDLLALKAQEAGVELSMRFGPDLPEVTADRRAFYQILIHLISNAVKFTPHGGRVTVSALRDGPKLAVTVEDTGVGIGDTHLSRLGEAFFQAHVSHDRNDDGSGLGLSIVKGLVHLHGGEVDIQSRLGEGTRVTVRLPLECEGGRSESDPVKLVANRNRSFPMVANVRVKKSA